MAVVDMISDNVHALVLEEFEQAKGASKATVQPDPEWQKVKDAGTTLWLDTGDLEEASQLFTAEFEALTTNNTLLNKEVQKGLYDGLVARAAKSIREAAPSISEEELVLEIAFVLNAVHGLKLVHYFDAHVSVELHTDLAHDVERSVAYGKRYHAICPERFIVKVPLTAAGYLSARKLRQEGIRINFTLEFGARQNYVAALVTKPNYVNVFMGRNNAFVADNGLGSGENVGEKATLATQQALLELRGAGRSETQLIGASMRTGAQVGTLAGLDVFTMPTGVARQYRQQPLEQVTSRIHDQLDVPLNDGVSLDDFAGATLWEITDAFKAAVDTLLAKDLDAMTAEELQEHFHASGCGGLLPKWSAEDIAAAAAGGKIPKLETWQNRLKSGEIGLDALMNLAALQSFVTDQKALDDRIRQHLN